MIVGIMVTTSMSRDCRYNGDDKEAPRIPHKAAKANATTGGEEGGQS